MSKAATSKKLKLQRTKDCEKNIVNIRTVTHCQSGQVSFAQKTYISCCNTCPLVLLVYACRDRIPELKRWHQQQQAHISPERDSCSELEWTKRKVISVRQWSCQTHFKIQKQHHIFIKYSRNYLTKKASVATLAPKTSMKMNTINH